MFGWPLLSLSLWTVAEKVKLTVSVDYSCMVMIWSAGFVDPFLARLRSASRKKGLATRDYKFCSRSGIGGTGVASVYK